jgi:NADH-quinone oxidoreductase subunit C
MTKFSGKILKSGLSARLVERCVLSLKAGAMNSLLKDIGNSVHERFGVELEEFRDQVILIVPPEKIVEVAQTLKDEFGFQMLSDETAVDYWPQEEPRFHVVYHLRDMQRNFLIMLRVPLNGSAPHLDTLEKVYPNANWFERELWDMFGIVFDGHTDLRRILMPYDWEGHPLRKDYPLGYEEVQFTFNVNDIQRRKPSPKE